MRQVCLGRPAAAQPVSALAVFTRRGLREGARAQGCAVRPPSPPDTPGLFSQCLSGVGLRLRNLTTCTQYPMHWMLCDPKLGT